MNNTSLAGGDKLAGLVMNNTNLAGGDKMAGLVSSDQYKSAHFVIYQVIVPIVALIGIVGNGMSWLILNESKAKNAFGTYLKALTIADICVLVVALVRFVVDLFVYFVSAETFSTLKAYEQICNGSVARSFFQTLTAGFVTIISVERFVAVLFPFKVKMFVLDRHPQKVVSVTLVLHVLMSIPTMFFSEIVTIVNPVTNTTSTIVRNSEFGKTTVPVFAIITITLKVLIPLIIVVSTTLAIVVRLRRQRMPGDSLRTPTSKWCLERDKMTRVLIVIATFFTCNATAALSITTMIVFFKDVIKRQPLLFLLCREARLVLVCLNSANDFIVYILSSKQFKTSFMTKFCSCRRVRDIVPSGTHSEQEHKGSGESTSTGIFHTDLS